jgi:hypothetical protein
LRHLTEDFRNRPAFRQKLANALNSLAGAHALRTDWDGAEKAWTEARDLLAPLAREFPQDADNHRYLGITLGNLGWLCSSRKDWQAARPLYEEAAASLRQALQPNPNSPPLLRALRTQYQSLAETRLQLGEHAAAADAAVALSGVREARAQDFYHAACFLARCAVLADKDERLSTEARRSAANRYVEQALDQLRNALSQANPHIDRLPDEPIIFRPLENHPEFKRLLARLAAPSAP